MITSFVKNVKALRLCSHVRMSGQVFYCCHKSFLRGLSLRLRRNRTPSLRDGAGELFEVTGGEPDLFSPHLWWMTTLHLLALSVTVNKTDGDRGAWCLWHGKGWMCGENVAEIEVYIYLWLSAF